MSFLVSLNVNVREIDLTNVVPAGKQLLSVRLLVLLKKFPVSSVTTISSEEELVQIFGRPQSTGNQFETFFTAANFLQYADNLKVVRAESAIKNATANGTGLLIRDDDHYQTNFEDGQGSVGEWDCKNCWNTWKRIRCFYLHKCDCIRTNCCNYNLWNRSIRQTIISVTDASVINVSDIVNFGEVI